MVDKLRSDWSKVMADPSIAEALRSMRDEHQKFGELIRSRGVKAQWRQHPGAPLMADLGLGLMLASFQQPCGAQCPHPSGL